MVKTIDHSFTATSIGYGVRSKIIYTQINHRIRMLKITEVKRLTL